MLDRSARPFVLISDEFLPCKWLIINYYLDVLFFELPKGSYSASLSESLENIFLA